MWGKKKSGPGVKFRNNMYVGIKPHPADPSPVTGDPRFDAAGKAPQDIDLTNMKKLLGYQLDSGSVGIGTGIKIKDNGEITMDKDKVSSRKPNLGAFGSR